MLNPPLGCISASTISSDLCGESRFQLASSARISLVSLRMPKSIAIDFGKWSPGGAAGARHSSIGRPNSGELHHHFVAHLAGHLTLFQAA